MSGRSVKQKRTVPFYIELVGSNARLRTLERFLGEVILERAKLLRDYQEAQEEHDIRVNEHTAALGRAQQNQASNWDAIQDWRQARADFVQRAAARDIALARIEREFDSESRAIEARLAVLQRDAETWTPANFEAALQACVADMGIAKEGAYSASMRLIKTQP
jgi:hypothetical protein